MEINQEDGELIGFVPVAHETIVLGTFEAQIPLNKNKDLVVIGIDTGVNTGIAIWNVTRQMFLLIQTVTIDQAFNLVKFQNPALVRYEDARLRKWFGKTTKERLQGAGSVKRDAKAWEDFLKNNGIPGEPVAPKDNDTKNTSDEFRRKTGWLKPTNEHGRDAGNLVWKFDERNLRNTLKVLGI